MIFEKQQYQEECVKNIIEVLKNTENLKDFSSLKDAVVALQEESNIPERKTRDDSRLDILMETGTGKTFTYIKTMYEINKQYGVNKFIVIVPRSAIREGVIQNIKLTWDYFFQEYAKRIKLCTYNGDGKIGDVLSYIRNDEFSVLILTSHSITSRSAHNRVLTQPQENLFGSESPMDAIGKNRPVIVIDEPHLLKGEGFTNTYNKYFTDSLCLRFGATFPVGAEHSLANVAYTLDSLSSFRDYLVKKISVTSITGEDTGIKFLSRDKNYIKISYTENGVEKSADARIRNDNLGAITGIPNLMDVYINKANSNTVYLTNEEKHAISDKLDYKLSEESIRAMIRKTIKIHFEKEQKLFRDGIKTLSLFFIPNISDFRGDNPIIKNIFDEEYKIQRQKVLAKATGDYKEYLQKDFDETGSLDGVRNGYFASDTGRNQEAKEADAIDKILRDKDRLLSTSDSLRFIFSVWALQEGWDNPNVFTICKLAPTEKETSRRQQVGRGLRIAVNSEGVRQTIKHCENDERFYAINMLDLVVSRHERNFIEGIQDEILANSYILGGDTLTAEMLKRQGLSDMQAARLIVMLEENGIVSDSVDGACVIVAPVNEFLKANKESVIAIVGDKYEKLLESFDSDKLVSEFVRSKHDQEMLKIRQDKLKEFKELWETITRKAKIVYKKIHEDELLQSVSASFNGENIPPIEIAVTKETYHHETNEIEKLEEKSMGHIEFFTKSGKYPKFVLDFAKDENLPLKFVVALFNKLDNEKIKNNPNRAKSLLAEAIKESVHANVIQSVGYNFDGDISIGSKSDIFYDEDGTPKTEIAATKIGRYGVEDSPADTYLYDKIRFDSGIEKESALKSKVSTKIDDKTIQVFAKLPKISIPTPYKNYSPDFAYFLKTDAGKKIFFVAETKGYDREGDIPDDERMKIDYAKKFFETLDEITPDIDVVFKQRINKDSLLELLQDIGA